MPSPPDPGRVLVLDGNGQAGLSVVRSLGRRGVSITAGSPRRVSLGCLSRYCDAHYTHPDPDEDAEVFVDHLTGFLEDTDHDVVVPLVDRTSVLLSMYKTEIEQTDTAVAVEDWETFERTYDKGRLFDLAESLAVPTPETYAPTSLADVEEIAAEVPYPAVVKLRSKTVVDDAGRCHCTRIGDDHYVESPMELIESYRSVLDRHPFLETHLPLVQGYVGGTTTDTVVLADGGDIVTHFQNERLRTAPPSGGVASLLRGVREPRMREYAAEVIDALGWTGPAMVEFMRTPDGEFYLIEVNGRYWGSLPFTIASGVDVPWLHYRQLCGLDVESPDAYRIGFLQQRLLYSDLKWLLERLRGAHLMALPEFLRTSLVARQTFVSFDDPLPTLWAVCQAIELSLLTLIDTLAVDHRDRALRHS